MTDPSSWHEISFFVFCSEKQAAEIADSIGSLAASVVHSQVWIDEMKVKPVEKSENTDQRRWRHAIEVNSKPDPSKHFC
jgi:hypothetical protein